MNTALEKLKVKVEHVERVGQEIKGYLSKSEFEVDGERFVKHPFTGEVLKFMGYGTWQGVKSSKKYDWMFQEEK